MPIIELDTNLVKQRVKNIPVALIISPSTFLADERVFPFLGPLKVASELQQNGNPVEVLDLSGYENYVDIVTKFALETKTKHFALTATTPQLPAAMKVVKRLKEVVPDGKIILGGPHATLTHSGMQEDLKINRFARGSMAFQQLEETFDKIVVGDGELAVFYALDPENPEKVVDASHIKSPLFLQKGTLENYSFPARDLIDMSSYHYNIDGHRAFSVIAQLGCPFGCGFCCGRDSNFLRVTRPRSAANTIAEIEQWINTSKSNNVDYSGVMFYDDELNVSTGNLETLCRQLILLQERLGVEMAFRGFVKGELFTPKQAELMYHAGFKILLSGIESGSNSILSAMKKNTTRETNSLLVNFAHDAGLKVKALMSLGHPGESEETIRESTQWVKDNLEKGWDDIDWTVITQYPGSPYFDHSVYDQEQKAWKYVTQVEGKPQVLYSREMDYAQDAYYYKGIPGEYAVYVWTDYLSTEQLAKLRDEVERETRSALGLPPITAVNSRTFEHSMGQHLPPDILRRSF